MAEIKEKIIKPLIDTQDPKRIILGTLGLAIALGIFTGYILSTKNKNSSIGVSPLAVGNAKSAQADSRTFKDFAEGTIKLKPQPSDSSEYTEGTHMLIRDKAVPVAITSSVVDLSQFEGKKVKIYGETQKALKEGWLMDVGKVEEIK
ncbi:MAG: hypothetical protein Q7R77_01475 [Candidatus Daviesbacteria bacterium]|nr:hypothetical protein [Candidatus Daviesbacteria bacterium]